MIRKLKQNVLRGFDNLLPDWHLFLQFFFRLRRVFPFPLRRFELWSQCFEAQDVRLTSHTYQNREENEQLHVLGNVTFPFSNVVLGFLLSVLLFPEFSGGASYTLWPLRGFIRVDLHRQSPWMLPLAYMWCPFSCSLLRVLSIISTFLIIYAAFNVHSGRRSGFSRGDRRWIFCITLHKIVLIVFQPIGYRLIYINLAFRKVRGLSRKMK